MAFRFCSVPGFFVSLNSPTSSRITLVYQSSEVGMSPSSLFFGEGELTFAFFASLALTHVSWSPPNKVAPKLASGTSTHFCVLGIISSQV